MLIGRVVFEPILRDLRQSEAVPTLLLDALGWLLQVVHPYNALLFGILAVLSILQLRMMNQGGGPGWGPPQPRQPWESDPDFWKKGKNNPWS
jgi:hypothetical protein